MKIIGTLRDQLEELINNDGTLIEEMINYEKQKSNEAVKKYKDCCKKMGKAYYVWKPILDMATDFPEIKKKYDNPNPEEFIEPEEEWCAVLYKGNVVWFVDSKYAYDFRYKDVDFVYADEINEINNYDVPTTDIISEFEDYIRSKK